MACNFPVATQVPQLRPAPTALPGGLVPLASATPAAPGVETQAAPTVQPAPQDSPTATLTAIAPGDLSQDGTTFAYTAQSGDTLEAVASRFGVDPAQVTSPQAIPAQGLIPPGQRLDIPNLVGSPPFPGALLPDSEVIYSPSTVGFSIDEYVSRAGGYLKDYSQLVGTETLSGAEVVRRVAEVTSTNPRLLLAVIEFRSHWVTSIPSAPNLTFPLEFNISEYHGLFLELSLVGKLLNMGYYGWRDGSLTRLEFPDGQSFRLAPQLNAGSVALQYFFARLEGQPAWDTDMYGPESLVGLEARMFGDPWQRAATVEPLFPPGMALPELELPFGPAEDWSLTAGPHLDWNTGTPRGALDFAPITGERPCLVSARWARASAPGVIVRSGDSGVLLDLDGDGNEQTGWDLFYLHLAQKERVAPGARVQAGDPLGHPSCEGGIVTGTHVHLARKFNGEWIGAGGALPFVLSGWTAFPGAQPYAGTLVKGSQVVTAHPDGAPGSVISR